MGYLVYDILIGVLALVLLPLLPWLLLTRFGEGLGERLGWLPPRLRRLDRPIWIHAASVGEVLSAQPLVISLRRHYPRRPIVISTTSLTGRATARAKLQPDAAMLLPIDVAWIVARVVRRLQPWCLFIVETELWPSLLRAAASQGVPVVMVSGRVAERSTRRYAWVRSLMRAMLGHVRLFAMQSEADAQRIVALGADEARVHVVGSLKYGREVGTGGVASSPLVAWLQGRPVVVAASTHSGEESFVLEAADVLWPHHPQLLLVIAPRRPQRFDEVAQWLRGQGVRVQRRSELAGRVENTTQVLLMDSLGELLDVFPVAQAVFVGGTLGDVGGHNVLEPATFAKPVSFGSDTRNVAVAADALLAAGAAARVHTAFELATVWREILDEPTRGAEIGRRGRAVVAAHADVAERTLALAAPFLDGDVR